MGNKVVAIFTNDRGSYYLEAIETLREMKEMGKDWKVAKTIDETENWRNYHLTKEELRNPTTFDGDQFIVISYLDEHIGYEVSEEE
jgi:hypothetical protein